MRQEILLTGLPGYTIVSANETDDELIVAVIAIATEAL